MSDFIFDKNPFPKDPEKIIEKVINIIGTVVDWIGNIAGKTGETDSINDNSSLENIDRIMSIFTDFREQEHTKAIEIENAVAKEVNYYVEELHDILDANADKVDKYNIHIKRIERQIDKIASKINGTIDNELCKKVSLDNTECKEIVKMIPGSKKEEAMNTFLDQSVNSALESCCKEIRNSLEEIYEDVETEVLGAVDTIQKQNELLKESLASVDENNYEVTAKEQMVEAYYMIDVCDAVSQIL